MNEQRRMGGSFAPPLSDELLDRYESLAEGAGGEVGDAMASLCAMCRAWWNLPDNDGPSTPHPVGSFEFQGKKLVADVVAMRQEDIDALWDLVPWPYECQAIQSLFDTLPTGSELRTPAFHLLWHAIELSKDREPITTDKLRAV